MLVFLAIGLLALAGLLCCCCCMAGAFYWMTYGQQRPAAGSAPRAGATPGSAKGTGEMYSA